MRGINEPTYLSCAVFTSNRLNIHVSIGISIRKEQLFLFLVLMLMSSLLLLVKTAQQISGFALMFLLMLIFMMQLFSLVL